MNELEKYFQTFRSNTVGNDLTFESPYGLQKLLYADWIASGRLYEPIERAMLESFGPYVGNTHSETSETGVMMTKSYHEAQNIIKAHVNASKSDIMINAGSGMTSVVNKLIRLLGLRVPEQLKDFVALPENLKPVVFISHLEHHSNQTSWMETICEVVVIPPAEDGTISIPALEKELDKYKSRQLKIGSFSACSNVTGIMTPVTELAKIMHSFGGYCFIDYACSAPYVDINMHLEDEEASLDAIFFSPHKFLGGPGTPGILIFNSQLYTNHIPDEPGGGTVDWTNPWGQYKFINNIEAREDGGTPPFLQTIKAALSVKLKEKMGSAKILEREHQLVKLMFSELEKIPHLHILAENLKERLGAFSLYIDNAHYNLIVRLLNDRFGIQTRGGCSCAGTYGHYLLHVDPNRSKLITDKIDSGDLSEKPGWVRISLHPTMHDDEVLYIADALGQIVQNITEWEKDYFYDCHKNEYFYKGFWKTKNFEVDKLFRI